MPSTCAVPFCSNKTGGHKFPRDKKLREKWIAAIRRVNFQPSEYSKVCKKHFKKDDYRLPKDSMQKYPAHVLKKDAVPSKFLWNEKNSTLLSQIRIDNLNQRCSVLQCKSGSSKNITLHCCPNQEAIRKKWAEVFKVNRDVVKNMHICSQHFLKTDYLSSNENCRTLKETAVPSQKLPRSTRILIKGKKVHRSKKEFLPIKSQKRAAKMTETKVVDAEPKVEQDEDLPNCRACLKKLESKASVCNIFQSWVPPWTGMEPTIAQELSKLANVEVTESDSYSKIICGACYSKLLDAAMFAASVRSCDKVLRNLTPEINTEDKVWPKPIQVDKNINGNILQEMDVDIKKEIVSDEEYEPISMDNAYSADNNYVETDLAKLDIKIEPEEILEPPPFEEPPPLTITINGTMSLNPSNTENKTLLNGTDDYEAIITEGVENTALCNGTNTNQQHLDVNIKEEPKSEDEDLEQVPDLSLDCLLCTKTFNSVTGLKAHVIAHHSYKSVKRKSGSAESPQKKQRDEYRCQICVRTFATSTDLMVHETCHNKHACYGCTRKFDTFKQLSKHSKRCKVPLNKTNNKHKTLDDVLSMTSQRKTTCPQEIIEAARQRVADGESKRSVAKELGMAESTLRLRLNRSHSVTSLERPVKDDKMDTSDFDANVKHDMDESTNSSMIYDINSSRSETEVYVDSEDTQSKDTVKSDCT